MTLATVGRLHVLRLRIGREGGSRRLRRAIARVLVLLIHRILLLGHVIDAWIRSVLQEVLRAICQNVFKIAARWR